jgi:hypothetical protein
MSARNAHSGRASSPSGHARIASLAMPTYTMNVSTSARHRQAEFPACLSIGTAHLSRRAAPFHLPQPLTGAVDVAPPAAPQGSAGRLYRLFIATPARMLSAPPELRCRRAVSERQHRDGAQRRRRRPVRKPATAGYRAGRRRPRPPLGVPKPAPKPVSARQFAA